MLSLNFKFPFLKIGDLNQFVRKKNGNIFKNTFFLPQQSKFFQEQKLKPKIMCLEIVEFLCMGNKF